MCTIFKGIRNFPRFTPTCSALRKPRGKFHNPVKIVHMKMKVSLIFFPSSKVLYSYMPVLHIGWHWYLPRWRHNERFTSKHKEYWMACCLTIFISSTGSGTEIVTLLRITLVSKPVEISGWNFFSDIYVLRIIKYVLSTIAS